MMMIEKLIGKVLAVDIEGDHDWEPYQVQGYDEKHERLLAVSMTGKVICPTLTDIFDEAHNYRLFTGGAEAAAWIKKITEE
jgi:hypothetical protein